MSRYTIYNSVLEEISQQGNLRTLPEVEHRGCMIVEGGRELLNLSSNDYLAIASDTELRREFFEGVDESRMMLGSTSARLLSGTHSSHRELEGTLEELFGRPVLTFSSGYGMNSGILPAISSGRTLILADKLVHASIIDGLRLSAGRFIRFTHQDFEQLSRLLAKHASEYCEVIIVVESIYSMDGDVCNLTELVELKKQYPNVMLYVDEAHAVGVRGARGLGVAEEMEVVDDIDFLCGTFGKAIGSVGAYVVCDRVLKEFLINKMRTFIFNTALPPINCEWTRWVFERMDNFAVRRENLATISKELRDGLNNKGYAMPSESHIVPVMVGESEAAVALSQKLKGEGVYALAVRPPTVPVGSARLRVSLNSGVNSRDVKKLLEIL